MPNPLPVTVPEALLGIILVMLCVSAFAWVAIYGRASRPEILKRRISDLTKPVEDRGNRGRSSKRKGRAAARRRDSIEDILKELEEERRARLSNQSRITLTLRMRQAGLKWRKTTYFLVCVVAGAATFALLMLLALSVPVSAGFAIAAGLLLPHLYVSLLRKIRLRRFNAEFTNAIDVMARGLRTGLPLTECLKMIATEASPPVDIEFRRVVEDQALGIPVPEALERLAQRIPLTEVNFLAIVISIQNQTGGSLSEAFDNLSKVLRERKKMEGKIKAMSQEAKSSAAIIGSLPILVSLALYWINPEYIMLLFTTTAGNFVIAGSVLWMLLGILVMWRMINFDF